MIYPRNVINHEFVEKYATFLHAKDLSQKWQTKDVINIRPVCDIFLIGRKLKVFYKGVTIKEETP